MNSRTSSVAAVLTGMAIASLFFGRPSVAHASWTCAKCHGVDSPSRAPSQAKLDSISVYSAWKSRPTESGVNRFVTSFNYAVKCGVTGIQWVETYPDDEARSDYLYLYNPQTKKHWARCLANRAPGTKAEWSIYVQSKGWVANAQVGLKIPGVGAEVLDPPLPPLE